MDEFVLQESTGYMLPALRFLAVFHTVISLLCMVGYYCLKASTDLAPYLAVGAGAGSALS